MRISERSESRPLYRIGCTFRLVDGTTVRLVSPAWEMAQVQSDHPHEVAQFDAHSGRMQAQCRATTLFWIPMPGLYPVHGDDGEVIGMA